MTSAYVWLSLEKYRLKRAVKHIILSNTYEDELEVLAFHKRALNGALNWQHDREFEFRGQMYDVVQTTETADSVFFLCWADHEETKLNGQLQALIDQMMHQKRKCPAGQLQWHDFFKLTFDIPAFCWSGQASRDNATRFAPYNFHYTSRQPKPSAPPPRTA